MVITHRTSVSRAVAIAIIFPTLLSLLAVIYFTWAAAVIEFHLSFGARAVAERLQKYGSDAPPIVVIYRSYYPYAWTLLTLAVLWAAWLLRRSTCRLIAVTLYVGVFVTSSCIWILLTLLAFYLHNECFSC